MFFKEYFIHVVPVVYIITRNPELLATSSKFQKNPAFGDGVTVIPRTELPKGLYSTEGVQLHQELQAEGGSGFEFFALLDLKTLERTTINYYLEEMQRSQGDTEQVPELRVILFGDRQISFDRAVDIVVREIDNLKEQETETSLPEI